MHRNVGGVKGNDLLQGFPETFCRVIGQTCNQVHVDIRKPCFLRRIVCCKSLRGIVVAADDGKHVVIHGLGVDGHTVNPGFGDGKEFLRIQSVGSAALHGEFQASGQVKMLPNGGKQPPHLGCCQGGGCAATHIQGADVITGFLQKCAGHLNFPDEGIQIRLHHVGEFFNAEAHKGAVGAPGGAEGDANVQGKVLLVQKLHSVQGAQGGIDANVLPCLTDEVGVLQHLAALCLGVTFRKICRGKFGRAYPGQSAPRGCGGEQFHGGKIVSLLQDAPAQAHRGICLFQTAGCDGGLAVVGDFCRGGQPRFTFV